MGIGGMGIFLFSVHLLLEAVFVEWWWIFIVTVVVPFVAGAWIITIPLPWYVRLLVLLAIPAVMSLWFALVSGHGQGKWAALLVFVMPMQVAVALWCGALLSFLAVKLMKYLSRKNLSRKTPGSG